MEKIDVFCIIRFAQLKFSLKVEVFKLSDQSEVI